MTPLKVFWPRHHARHRPSKDYSDGLPPFDHLEVPGRVDEMLAGIRRAVPVDEVAVEGNALDEVRELHADDYVDFLLEISAEIEAGREYIPPVFRADMSASPLAFRGGMYCAEVGTPIGPGSISAALNSAATAVAAARHLLASGDDVIALCRPPGHHAGCARYGGYCFFNNAYLGARVLSHDRCCAVFDIDYHIGDGSIEFANKNAPYYSLHADPYRNYPYLDSSQRLDNPDTYLRVFPSGIDGRQYLDLVKALADEVAMLRADTVIVSLGFDTLETDYIQDEYIHVSVDDYAELGQMVAAFDSRVMILLEGGYDIARLADCAASFTQGFVDRRATCGRRR